MDYDDQTYGEIWAESYDDHFPAPAEGSLDVLRELAGEGPVLELGLGTGRLAGPLAREGLAVHGVEASDRMLEKLRARWGDDIKLVARDFSEFQTEEKYSLAFVVFNTFFALLSQEAQISCMQSVAASLKPGGRFLLELFIPDLGRFDRGQRLSTLGVENDGCRIEASTHDPVAQIVESQMIRLSPTGMELKPVKVRYAWPAEIDLMARLAGLKLVHRWGGWQRQPFDSYSRSHISVYQRPS